MEIFPNWTFIPVVTLLIILFIVLKRVFFVPMEKVLAERSSRIEGAQKEAEEIIAASQGRLSDFDRRMREGRRESDMHMAQIKSQALNEKSRIIAEKRSESEAFLKQARQEIRSKTEEAAKTLVSQSKEFAKKIASHILKRPVSGKKMA